MVVLHKHAKTLFHPTSVVFLVGYQKFRIFSTHSVSHTAHINFKICGCKPVFAPRPPNSCGDVLRDRPPPVVFQMYSHAFTYLHFTAVIIYTHKAYMRACQTSVHLWSFRLFNLWLRLLHIFSSFLVKL